MTHSGPWHPPIFPVTLVSLDAYNLGIPAQQTLMLEVRKHTCETRDTWEEVKTLSIEIGAEEIISADWRGLPACWADEEEAAAAGSAKGMLGMWDVPWGMPCAPVPGMCSLSQGEQ